MSLTISPARIVEESGSPLLVAPDSWPRRPLGDVATILNGFAFKSKQFVADGGVPLIRIRDIFNDHTTVGYVGEYDDRYLVRQDELLVGMDGDFNCSRWRGPEALLNQRVCKITPDPHELDLDFLTHILPGYLWAIHDLTSSTTVTHLSSRDIAQIPIPVPPVVEQRDIARLFETAALKRRSSSSHLGAARRAIERFRQAVLAAAYREASTWIDRDTQVPLSDVLREPLKNGYSARPVNHETPFRVLTLTATTSGWFDRRHFKYTDEEFPPESPFWLAPGDIVIQRGNTAEYVGVPALYDGDPGEYLYPDLMIRARVLPEIDPRFAWYMLLAPQTRNYLRDRATGSAGNMPKINQKVLVELPIPLPPIDARQQIVAKLDKALTLATDVSNRVEAASRRVERSSQAVLAKVFRGELIPGHQEDGPAA